MAERAWPQGGRPEGQVRTPEGAICVVPAAKQGTKTTAKTSTGASRDGLAESNESEEEVARDVTVAQREIKNPLWPWTMDDGALFFRQPDPG